MLLTSIISLNVVFTIAAAPLAALVGESISLPLFPHSLQSLVGEIDPISCRTHSHCTAFLVLYLITHPRLTRSPLHTKRPLTLTQHNTLLNRNENGGTGVWSRKWRRKVAVALAIGPTRRGLGDMEDDDDEEGDQVGEGGEKLFERNWRVKVKPVPKDLKGCLKREGSFEVAKRKDDTKEEGEVSRIETDGLVGEEESESNQVGSNDLPSPSPSPSISVSSSSSHSFYSPPLPSPSPPLLPVVTSTSVPPRARKTVSILEPSLVELEALRELWDSPDMQSSVNGGFGLGGIAGYRRTRDYYARGQGGRGVNKTASSKSPSPAPSIPKPTLPTPAIEKEKEKEKTTSTDPEEEITTEEESPRLPSSSLAPSGTRRSAVPTLARQSSSSLSPSPVSRRPLIKRALSPNASAGSGVGVNRGTSRAGSSRRGPSPSNLGSNRTASISPSPAVERAQPRWVKTKKSTLPKPTIGAEEEDDELGGTGRNGTMSATVPDDDEEDGYEDVPPTPPSQPSLSLAMAPLSTTSSTTTSSSISPSLELLLDHTNRSLIKHDSQSRSIESPMSGSESIDDSPSPLPHSINQLPNPSPSPTLSPGAKSTPSFEITPASPDSQLVPLPPLPPLSTDSMASSRKEVASERGEMDPNDPISSPTVEAKGGGFSTASTKR